MTDRDKRLIENARRIYAGEARERELIARDIVWHVPGHNPVSGEYHGWDEYFGTMGTRMQPLDRWEFEVERIMVNGLYVVANIHLVGDRKGKQIDTHGSHILRFSEAGQVVEGWGFTQDQDGLDEFFRE